MFPGCASRRTARQSVPSIRGVVHCERVLPRPLGEPEAGPDEDLPDGSAPRARGDGPFERGTPEDADLCSPRPWGWSFDVISHPFKDWLLPASAGMTPCRVKRSTLGRSAPCARREGPRSGLRTVQHRLLHACCVRGDDPSNGFVNLGTGICSSRPRGWSSRNQQRPDRRFLLPALAGMVPTSTCPRLPSPTAPRACGDGPMEALVGSMAAICSLHPRGWSPSQGCRPPRPEPPAPPPAGMVPFCPARRILPRPILRGRCNSGDSFRGAS